MGLTLEDVGNRTSVGPSSLSEFENSKREPRLPQLTELADLYRRSLSFFLCDEPLPTEVVLWRQKPASPFLEDVQRQLLRLAEQYHRLEQWCSSPEELDLPFASGDARRYSYQRAEKLAHDFRNTYGLGDRPGRSLLRVLEEVCKVKIFHLPFEPSGSAACTLSDQFGAAVLLNSRNARWRRNFDLAHELFHLLTWRIFRWAGEPSQMEASEDEEKFANCFAANLLMPREPLGIALDGQSGGRAAVTFDDLFEVARQFDVSTEALIWRVSVVLNRPRNWAHESVEKLRQRITYWEQRDHDEVPIRPLRYEVLASEALRRGMISTGKYAEYVGITRREAMRQVEQEVSGDAEVEITNP